MKKEVKTFIVKPTIYAACVELTGSLSAGGLLCQIHIRSEGKTLKNEEKTDGWLCLSSQQWRATTGFTRHQHDKALAILKELDLIEHYRRKLRYDAKAALVWLRLTPNAKSAIAEILCREGISAFSDNEAPEISQIPDNASPETSANAELLKEMNNTKNEISLNVVIPKTTTGQQEKKKAKSPGKNKIWEEKNKAWFKLYMKEIYEGTSYSPDAFSKSSFEALSDMVEYLSENNVEGVPDVQGPAAHLRLIVQNWNDFVDFVSTRYKGYGFSEIPLLWCIRQHLKAIPDFVGYMLYVKKIKTHCEQSGVGKTALKELVLYDEYLKFRELFLLDQTKTISDLLPKHIKSDMTEGQLKMLKLKNL